MKTFADLKQDDKIYYWDHGKLHEQIVYSIKQKEKVDEWKDWHGVIQRRIYNVWTIKAGQGTGFDIWYDASYTIYRCNGLTRFSCIEAAREWLNKKNEELTKRANRYKKQYDRARSCAERYKNEYNRIF